MSSCLVHAFKPCRVAFVLAVTCLLSAWTCTAIVNLNGCDSVLQPNIASLSPDTVSTNGTSVLLTVSGTDFVSNSQILWNGHALPTTHVDSGHLQSTITQQTFDSFGGSPGNDVLISVESFTTGSASCSDFLISGTLALVVN